MRKLTCNDYSWIILRAQSISEKHFRDITLINLGNKVCSSEEISISLLSNALNRRLTELLAKERFHKLSIQMRVIEKDDEWTCLYENVSLARFDIKKFTTELLSPVIQHLEEQPESYAVQVCFTEENEENWKNFIFYVE